MRILVVEDEKKVAGFIRRGLKEQSYAVDVSHDGLDGLERAISSDYDLVILDLMLPKLGGLELLKELRRSKRTVPVLILTARGSVQNRIDGLDAGSDDYLVKPFAFGELLARIRMLLRRSRTEAATQLECQDLVLDLVTHKATRAGRVIELTAKEYALLEYFMRHPRQMLTRTMIAEHVWGMDFETFTNVIDVYVARLRQKINADSQSQLIHTWRGMGYKLLDE